MACIIVIFRSWLEQHFASSPQNFQCFMPKHDQHHLVIKALQHLLNVCFRSESPWHSHYLPGDSSHTVVHGLILSPVRPLRCHTSMPTPSRSPASADFLDMNSKSDMTISLGLTKVAGSRRIILLLTFCLSQFVDVVNNASIYVAIPTLIKALDMTNAEAYWLISSYQLTLGSFVLIVRAFFTYIDYINVNLNRAGKSLMLIVRVRKTLSVIWPLIER